MDKNIVLIGMPGSGKSTIGELLSKLLGLKLYDVDQFIEKTESRSISELFITGEEYFRAIETKAIGIISSYNKVIISTGGGTIKSPHNMEMLRDHGLIIFISRPLNDIIADIDTESRPLLKNGKEKIYELYQERYPLYKKYCDYEIINDKDINLVCDQISNLILK
ncbi:shikimate kinase [Clostridium akagii]|uniref:shikimate kinase n=1 Tax=Clostridium akagii TaxID=91623 RepID=UPI00047ADD3B|nr:shikimate kinase [Clostridium akagii]